MLYYPEKCMRGCADCQPLSQIASDEEPISFICMGENDGTTRTVEQDRYRLCFKSAAGWDSKSDNDRRDLVDLMSVIAQGLSMLEQEALDPDLDCKELWP